MEFFISMSHSDPLFSEIFDDCNILLSPCNTRRSFNVNDWKSMPKKMIIDSGAYNYLASSKMLPPQKIAISDQIRIIQNSSCQTILTHLDSPISMSMSSTSNVFHSIEHTLGNSYEFISLFHKYELEKNGLVAPMAVIQGIDRLTIQYCAYELKKIGFKIFGIGSLAGLYNSVEILNRIKYASEVVGSSNLHVFGISRLDIIDEMNRMNIMSTDSSRPMKAAIFNAIFYSNPFRTYGIYNSRNAACYNKDMLIIDPLPCECPICQQDAYLLVGTGKRLYTNARAIHNYYHLAIQLGKKLTTILMK